MCMLRQNQLPGRKTAFGGEEAISNEPSPLQLAREFLTVSTGCVAPAMSGKHGHIHMYA